MYAAHGVCCGSTQRNSKNNREAGIGGKPSHSGRLALPGSILLPGSSGFPGNNVT